LPSKTQVTSKTAIGLDVLLIQLYRYNKQFIKRYTMEVASPLTFGHVQVGSKRRFACSPILDTQMGVDNNNNVDDFAMDDCNAFSHTFKRRRCGSPDNLETVHSSAGPSSFKNFSSPQTGISGMKRSRHDEFVQDAASTSSSSTHAKVLQKIIDKQSTEIQALRDEKSSMEHKINELTSTQEKTLHENRILKKAVTLQQQRQNHASVELEASRAYKDQAEDKMRKLEQLINTLKYHLQAQQPHIGKDFMGFNHSPPDVY